MKSKSSILVFASLGIVAIAFLNFSNKSIIAESVTFDTSIAEDATMAVLARIREAKKQPLSEIKFEKGTYHFYPDKAYESFVQISNHDDVLASTPFPLFGFKNLTIDGQGSTFIFHGRMIPFLIDNCANISVRNLSVDWAVPFNSEMLIVANDEKNKTFDVQISDDYPYVIRDGQLIFIKEYYEHTIGQSILFDPERKAIAFDTEAYTPLSSKVNTATKRNLDKVTYKYRVDHRAPPMVNMTKENRLMMEELKPGLVRIHNHIKKLPRIGLILVGKGEKNSNRVAPAFRLTDVDGFKAKNVTVHHASGMGLIAENSADLMLDSFNVIPSNGRMVSTTADATHFVGCRGKVVLKNCTFNNMLDDATNVHGSYQEIMDVLGEKQIGVRMGHVQQQGFSIGKTNDTLGIVRLNDSFFPFDKVTIKSIEKINGRYQIITLNEKLPAGVVVGDLLENLNGYPELLVENCNISRNRARGLLISTPKKTVIRNNYFHTEMEAILLPVESSHWFESGNAANVTIENNVFQDCQHSGFNRGVIRFATDDKNENIAFKNITITKNKFNQFDNLILDVVNTNGLKFTNNTITNSGTFKQLHAENPAFRVSSSEHIVFKNNNYSGKAKDILKADASMAALKFN